MERMKGTENAESGLTLEQELHNRNNYLARRMSEITDKVQAAENNMAGTESYSVGQLSKEYDELSVQKRDVQAQLENLKREVKDIQEDQE